ncbi:MAG: hypothetical protein U0350_18145 [Caldilineaceae bacterium]
MQYEILLTKQPNNGYTARPLAMPELTVTANNEAEALVLVRQAIAKLQQTSHIVQIDVPSPSKISANDPWQPFWGMWADDPDWELFQAEVVAYRQQLDQAANKTDEQ